MLQKHLKTTSTGLRSHFAFRRGPRQGRGHVLGAHEPGVDAERRLEPGGELGTADQPCAPGHDGSNGARHRGPESTAAKDLSELHDAPALLVLTARMPCSTARAARTCSASSSKVAVSSGTTVPPA